MTRTLLFTILYDEVYDFNYDNDFNYLAADSSDAANQLENFNAKIQDGKTSASLMTDSGSVCSIVTKTFVEKILKSTPSARLINTKFEKDLKTFSYEPIKSRDKITATVVYNDWIGEEAGLTFVEDGHKLIIGSDFFSSLGLAVVQQQAKRG